MTWINKVDISFFSSSDDHKTFHILANLSLRRIVQKIASILIALDIKEYPNAKELAILLCKEINEISVVC
jgi:hypothetical protein